MTLVGEVILNTLFIKYSSAFLCFAFLLCYELFSIPVENKKYGEGHNLKFNTSNKLNEYILNTLLLKKLIFKHLMAFDFYGKLKLLEVRNNDPEVTVFCYHFYLKMQIIFC